MSEPLKSAEAIKEMGEAVLCLHIALHESIANDVQQRWDNLMLALEEREEAIREDQRKQCHCAFILSMPRALPTGELDGMSNAILNAGKEDKP